SAPLKGTMTAAWGRYHSCPARRGRSKPLANFRTSITDSTACTVQASQIAAPRIQSTCVIGRECRASQQARAGHLRGRGEAHEFQARREDVGEAAAFAEPGGGVERRIDHDAFDVVGRV